MNGVSASNRNSVPDRTSSGGAAGAGRASAMSPSNSGQISGASTPEATPDVDFVLVFESIPKKYIKPGKVPSSEKSAIAAEYERLIKRIESVGVHATAREGKVGSGQILIFLKASDEALVKIGKEENLIDYLHGVAVEPASTSSIARTSSLPQQGTHNLATSHLSSADRIRHLYTLLTLPAEPATSDGITRRGAGLRLKAEEFPHLIDWTPVHDPAFNRKWLKQLSSSNKILSIGIEDLDEIKRHFGEHIAVYFAFLLFYFQALAPVAAIGGIFWIAGAPYNPVYSFLLVIWACLFVETWRIKERKLAVRWGTLGCGAVDSRRINYKPQKKEIDKVTGEEIEVFEWWRRELRMAGAVPAIIFFAALLGFVMTVVFITEVFVARLYEGPGQKFIPLAPTALFSICVPQIMAAWTATARGLTEWENHFSQRDFDWSMTVKMFALQAFVAYGALTLSAFVYIPFGQSLMDHIVAKGYFAGSIANAISSGSLQRRSDGGIQFEINPNRMHAQLFAVLTTSQAINAFMEVALPFILRKVGEWRAGELKKPSSSSSPSSASGAQSPTGVHPATDVTEKKFLKRVFSELELPPYDTFGDYAEMATQFGYISLWSLIWPLAPLGGLVNNFFEMRGDALKISINVRRPVPLRSDSIGPWLEIFGHLAWAAAMMNAALIYLFQRSPEADQPGHSVYEATLRTHIHPGGAGSGSETNLTNILGSSSPQSALSFSHLLPSFLPTHGPSGAMIAALLVALASEHVYGVFLSAIRHVLERALWRGSEEEVSLKRREWKGKKEAVAKAQIGPGPQSQSSSEKPPQLQLPSEGFWDPSKDVGVDAVRNTGKTE